MNHSSNDFDNILRQQVEDSTFEYSDAYWNKAAALLDAAEGKRKRRGAAWWLWRVSGVLLLISMMAGGYLLLPLSDEHSQPNHLALVSTTQQTPGIMSSTNVAPSDTQNEALQSATLDSNPTQASSAGQSYSAQSPKTSALASGVSTKAKASGLQRGNNMLAPAAANNNRPTPFDEFKRLGSEPAVSANDNSASQNTLLGSAANTATNVETRFPAEIPPVFPVKAGTLGIPFLPSEMLSPAAPIKPSGKKPKHPVNGLFAGVNVSTPMGNRNDIGVGLYAGFQTGISLGSKVSVVVQPGFALQNGVNLEVKSTKTTYDFDIRQVSKTIDYNRLYQLEAPIVAQFHPNSRLTLQLGAGASYLFMSNAQVSDHLVDLEMARTGTTSTANLRENKFESATRNVESMECKGLSKVDVFMKAGVQYRIYKNLHVHLTAQKGLIDQTDNTFFANSANHTSLNARVGVSYLFD